MTNPLLAPFLALSIFSGGIDTIYAQAHPSESVPECDLESYRKTVLVVSNSVATVTELQDIYPNAHLCATQGINLGELDVDPTQRVRLIWLKGSNFLPSREAKRLTAIAKPDRIYIYSRSFGY